VDVQDRARFDPGERGRVDAVRFCERGGIRRLETGEARGRGLALGRRAPHGHPGHFGHRGGCGGRCGSSLARVVARILRRGAHPDRDRQKDADRDSEEQRDDRAGPDSERNSAKPS
jgi:hypothetical protein